MKLRSQMLEIPLGERLSYDADKNILFLNFEGLSIRSHADIERVRQTVIDKLSPLGHKVYAIVNYDRFSILPELVDDYVDMVKETDGNLLPRRDALHVQYLLPRAARRSPGKGENRRAELRNGGRGRSKLRRQ
jgi:hypothetical protein